MSLRNLLSFFFALVVISSCKKSVENNDSDTLSKIYFNGYNPNLGTSGITWDEIYSINADGTNQTQLTNFSNNGTRDVHSIQPGFNFDSSRLCYVSNNDPVFPFYDIYSMNFNGSDNFRKVWVAYDWQQFFNPIGFQLSNNSVEQYLIEIRNYDGTNYTWEIASIHWDGTVMTLYTPFPSDGNCKEPFWNQTHEKLIYTSDKTSSREIYILDKQTGLKQQITYNGLEKSSPKYSPDGSKIVFVSTLNSGAIHHSEIFIMSENGSNPIQLTNYSNGGSLPFITRSPTFSPGGRKIIYTSNESGVSQIYEMNVDGSNKQKLTNSNIEKFNPIAL